MRYFSKKRFTMRQVVGLLTVVFLGISVIAYAAVTIPNSFSSGTTISSGQVNANFTAVANQMPGAKVGAVSSSAVQFTTAITNITTLTVPAPGPGVVIFSVSGLMGQYDHVNGTADQLRCFLGSVNNIWYPNSDPANMILIPAALPSFTGSLYGSPLSIIKSVSVGAAGNVTAYLNCQSAQGGQNGFVQYYQMTGVFVPNQY